MNTTFIFTTFLCYIFPSASGFQSSQLPLSATSIKLSYSSQTSASLRFLNIFHFTESQTSYCYNSNTFLLTYNFAVINFMIMSYNWRFISTAFNITTINKFSLSFRTSTSPSINNKKIITDPTSQNITPTLN